MKRVKNIMKYQLYMNASKIIDDYMCKIENKISQSWPSGPA